MFKEQLDSKISQIQSSIDRHLQPIEDNLDKVDIESIEDLKKVEPLRVELNRYILSASKMSINFDIKSLKDSALQEIDDKIKAYENDKFKVELQLKELIESTIGSKTAELRAKNEDIRKRNEVRKAEIDAHNSVYQQLEVKRQSLEQYAPEILTLCSTYGINTSDIRITSDMFTTDELMMYYDQFLAFISKDVNRINIIKYIREKVVDPIYLALILLLFIVACMTPALNIIAVVFYIYLAIQQNKQKFLVKKYSIMLGLVYNVKPMEMGLLKELKEDDLEVEVSEDIDIDNDPEFDLLYEQINSELEKFDDDILLKERENLLATFTTEYGELKSTYDAFMDTINARIKDIVDDSKDYLCKLEEREKYLKDNVSKLGESFNESRVLNTKFKLGVDTNTFIYEEQDIGLQNLLFKDNRCTPQEMNNFIKVMIINILSNVRPGTLAVTFYDPNNLSKDFRGFNHPDSTDIIKFESTGLDELIKKYKDVVDRNLNKLKGMNLLEYNRNAEEKEQSTIDYELLVVLSQPKTIEEAEDLKEFMKYSASYGVVIWVVSSSSFTDVKTFSKPFENISKPIILDGIEDPIKFINAFNTKRGSLKTKALMWRDYANKTIPDNEVWTGNCDEYVEFDIGYEDGDPARNIPFTVGNEGDIHAIGFGGTGAGKSVLINNLIINMCRKYHPRNLELWLVDFKRVEFAAYLNNAEHPFSLPHIRTCLCTTDPEFATSTFTALRIIGDERYRVLEDAGHKNIFTYNREMRRNGTPEKCFTRIVMIVDEFQVPYVKGEPKTKDLLNKEIESISKVARAAGIHLFFTSQSMKNTFSADVLTQFSLRLGLRCDSDVSEQLMGANTSGSIREKNGWLYVRNLKYKASDEQKKYRTPFIPDDDLYGTIKMLSDKADKEGYVRDDVATYNEAVIPSVEELDNVYKLVEERNKNTDGLIFLGERMLYSKNKVPKNIILNNQNNQHIMAVFSDMTDYVNFVKSIYYNISRHKNDCKLLFNYQVEDIGYLCHVDEKVAGDEVLTALSSNKCKIYDFTTFIETTLQSRKEQGKKDTPVYVFCLGWDKAVGFGVDPDYKLIDRLGMLLETCSEYNIHFIFVMNKVDGVPIRMIKAVNHRIAGKLDGSNANKIVESNLPSKIYESMDNGYMFVLSDNKLERVKIYQSVLTRTVQEKELIL